MMAVVVVTDYYCIINTNCSFYTTLTFNTQRTVAAAAAAAAALVATALFYLALRMCRTGT